MAGFGHLPLATQVSVLRGLGPARLEALREGGIATLRDLLWSLPFRYLDRGSVVPLGDLALRGLGAVPEGREIVTVMGEIRDRSEEHTSELQSPVHLVCRLLLEKKKQQHK